MSRRNRGQPIDGLLLLDKPFGISSNAAVQRAKRLFQAAKVGHTGSLDPIATGVLPLCFGEATKLSGFLLDTDKGYRVRVRLGRTTTTADIEGETLRERPTPELTAESVEAVLRQFRGDQLQIPPMYSALKHQGQRLYDLARQGKEVERTPRAVTVYRLDLLGFGDDWLDLDVHCSKGTYIRSLAVDIGECLGCGGHVEVLRRTRVGEFAIDRAVTLEGLEALEEAQRLACLVPMDQMVRWMPQASLDDEGTRRFLQGQAVRAAVADTAERVRVYDPHGRFIGLADARQGVIHPCRVLHRRTETDVAEN
ncbi:MAG: tRNA pseudouridine(55) synthase TruB [Methylococcaceae bacterium]|nr:tRNA pseudouridine(55) synthase TruB [Methylococcaceae bacterium]